MSEPLTTHPDDKPVWTHDVVSGMSVVVPAHREEGESVFDEVWAAEVIARIRALQEENASLQNRYSHEIQRVSELLERVRELNTIAGDAVAFLEHRYEETEDCTDEIQGILDRYRKMTETT